MAEHVQANLEKMLTELEQLERIQLLSNEEVKLVIKKRKNFEYKMQKKQKQKNDILAYIKYESSLLNLIALRRDQAKYMNKKNEIDHAIAKRINKLFRILEHRFPADLMVWSSHMAFLKEMEWNESIGKIYRRMLQVHPDKVNLWISAGRFEIDGNNTNKKVNYIENARTIFMEGLRFHPQSIDLIMESFRLELLFVQKLKTDPENYIVPEENKDAILNGKVAETVCKRAVEALDNSKENGANHEEAVKLLLQMLRSAKQLSGGYSLQSYIVEMMVQKFPKEPLAWLGYANAALYPAMDKDCEEGAEDDYIPNVGRSAFDKVQQFCSRLEESLIEKLPVELPANRQKLLDLYMDSLNYILEEVKNVKICEFVAKRVWYLLMFSKQNSLMNERNSNTYETLMNHIEQ